MASYNNQIIDLPAIEENYGNFKNSQYRFGAANGTFTNGYLRSCGDKNIKNAFKALDETYKKIRNGYTSIDDWWKSYTKDVASLEKSIIGAGADFDEGSISTQVAKLPRLGKGTVPFSGIPSILGKPTIGVGMGGIFADGNRAYNQFGGNQMDITKLLSDERALSIIRSRFPNADVFEIYELLLAIQNSGCEYVAAVNTIFVEFEGREDEFERIFGFPMYVVKTDTNAEYANRVKTKTYNDYNYEYLILEYFLYRNVEHEKRTDIQFFPNADSKDFALNRKMIGETFPNWIKEEYNIEVTYDKSLFSPTAILVNSWFKANKKTIENHLNNGEHVIITAVGFDLLNPNTRKIEHFDVGGHGMSIVEVKENGDVIVSSWGEKYILDMSGATHWDLAYLKYD